MAPCPTLATDPLAADPLATDALPVERVRELLLDVVTPLRQHEAVALPAALGRVLAQDLVAGMDIPPHDNAGMDGYALRGSELDPNGEATLRVSGAELAGHVVGLAPAPGHCVRIMTGAVLPPACDTVVPHELCGRAGNVVRIPPHAARPGDNVRRRGEDLQTGSVAIAAGKLLRPADLGLAASLGLNELTVRRRLCVALLSSGDELRSAGQGLSTGMLFDSNRATLQAMLARLGCETLDLGLVPDHPGHLEAALRRGCEQADVIISSGGIGAGDADHMRLAAQNLGALQLWRVAMRPGRPLACAQLTSGEHRAVLFGLPGNPVAMMVSFYMLVRDALLHMMGALPQPQPLSRVVALHALRKRPGRTEFQRARLEPLPDGRWGARVTGNQGSGALHTMSQAHGLLVLHPAQGEVRAGELVDFLGFEGLV